MFITPFNIYKLGRAYTDMYNWTKRQSATRQSMVTLEWTAVVVSQCLIRLHTLSQMSYLST